MNSSCLMYRAIERENTLNMSIMKCRWFQPRPINATVQNEIKEKTSKQFFWFSYAEQEITRISTRFEINQTQRINK